MSFLFILSFLFNCERILTSLLYFFFMTIFSSFINDEMNSQGQFLSLISFIKEVLRILIERQRNSNVTITDLFIVMT